MFIGTYNVGPSDITGHMKTRRQKSAKVPVSTPQDGMGLRDTAVENTQKSMAFPLDRIAAPLNYFYSMSPAHIQKRKLIRFRTVFSKIEIF